MKIDRWVIDTNVLISAALLPRSVPAQVLVAVLNQGRIVFSDATFSELSTRLWKPKFDRYTTLEQRKLLLHDLAAVAEWVNPGPGARHSRDPSDDPFIHTALAANARALISGDADLLVLQAVEQVVIVSPAQALRWMV